MALWLALPLFVLSVVAMLAAAALFADRLDHIGPRVGLPEALTGLVTALAADGPEISSALIALAQGEKRVSLGVVLGSNVFNLAAMISLVLCGALAGLRVRGAFACDTICIGLGSKDLWMVTPETSFSSGLTTSPTITATDFVGRRPGLSNSTRR